MSILQVATWQHVDMSLGARVWYAYHCLPLDPDTGKLPPATRVEEEHEISRGLLGKLFNGRQHEAKPPVIKKLANAFGVSEEWLAFGRGPWPSPSVPVPPRVVTHAGQEEVKPPRREVVAPPADTPSPGITRVYETEREADRRGSLKKVRERLYERYDKRKVDELVGSSDFIDAEQIDEIDAFIFFDNQLAAERFAKKHRQAPPGERVVTKDTEKGVSADDARSSVKMWPATLGGKKRGKGGGETSRPSNVPPRPRRNVR